MNDAPSPTATAPLQYYGRRLAKCRDQINELTTKKNRVSRSRAGVIAVWLGLFVFAVNGWLSTDVAWWLAGLAFLGLVGLAAWDQRLLERIAVKTLQAELSSVQVARIERRWTEVPEVAVSPPASVVGESRDLDLFGHASVFQLACRAHTLRGQHLLRDWLSSPSSIEEIVQRNAAAAKLAGMREFREKLDLRGRLLRVSDAGPDALIEWAESEPWLEKRPWLKWGSRLSVATWITAALLGSFGVIPESLTVLVVGVLLMVQFLAGVLMTGKVHDIFEQVDSRQHDVTYYQELFAMFDELPNDPSWLAQLRESMSGKLQSKRALQRLAHIMRVAQMRHSAVFGIFHLIIHLFFLIDFHVLSVLESWQRTYAQHVRAWFDALGQLEAVSSLASLVHDYPDWTFPNLDAGLARFEAKSLGHPLLPAPVRNDITIGPRGTFILVTGSNMSGKSTLLRSIGVNVVLAQAGAPVSAASMSLPPVRIATSMRIQDSLEDGVSFFMAELQRLKSVIDHAEQLQAEGQTQLFLLDEILQGTNSAERHIAVAKVAGRLTRSAAMGAISTHDLALASHPDVAASCHAVHFKESFGADGRMTFDYRLREGLATTTNALKLLELVGIRDAD